MASQICSPVIPCVESVPAVLKPGNLIRISGTPDSSATCFAVNLQNGSSLDPRSDIALHLSPVFSPPPRLVRNSLENQNWGPEESHGTCFPFVPEQTFEILILAESDHFKIAVNGQHFTEFHYRLPLENISHIAIDGDVVIHEIKFEILVQSAMEVTSGDVSNPLGFVVEPKIEASLSAPHITDRSPSPSSLPYPTNPSFGPSPSSYLPSPSGNPYGPPPGGMYPQIPSTYGPPPGGAAPYGPPPGNYPYSPTSGYPQQTGNYPQGYPQQTGNYPQGYPQQTGNYAQGYPQQPGSYPQGYPPQQGYPQGYPYQQGSYPGYPQGTSVVYPGQEKKSGGFDMSSLATAGAAALAGAAGSGLLGHKKHKKHKHGYGIPGMGGAGPASLIGGVGSLLSGSGAKHGQHGTSSGSSFPLGGALATGAAALAGTYMLSKSPIGKMMKPKKMKKLYKGHGSSSSSSSSSSD